jgi:hypothetical protein
MTNRFELEQSFLRCWDITEDLRLLAEKCEEIDNVELADEISNIVLGIQSIYECRFQKAFDQFEELLRSGDIK